MPTMSSRELIKRLRTAGWYEVHQVGSQKQFKHPALPGRVTIPHPVKDLPVGTWKSILRQAGLGQNEEE